MPEQPHDDLPLSFTVDVTADGVNVRAAHLAQTPTNPQPQVLPSPSSPAPPPRPTVLGMAASFTGSMAKFAASGFKTVDASTHWARIQKCRVCEHRQGTRCRLCGCFFDAKARLPHERCLADRW